MAKKLTVKEKAQALVSAVNNQGADAAAELAKSYVRQQQTTVQPAKSGNWYDGLFGAAGASAPAVAGAGLGAQNAANAAAQMAAAQGFGDTAKMAGDYFVSGVKTGATQLGQGMLALGDVLQSVQNAQLQDNYMMASALGVKDATAHAQNQQNYAKAATDATNAYIMLLEQQKNARQQQLDAEYADRTGFGNTAVKTVASGVGAMTPYLVAGMLGGAAGVGGAGTAVMGIQSAGGGMGEALADGATTEQARANALWQGVTAAGTEKLIGGIPGLKQAGGMLDDAVNAVAGKVGGKTAQGLAKWGLNALGEGVEEMAEEALNELGANLAYGKRGSIGQTVHGEKSVGELAGEYGQTFAGGALIGGVLDAAGGAVRGAAGSRAESGAQNQNLQATAQTKKTAPEWWDGLFGGLKRKADLPNGDAKESAISMGKTSDGESAVERNKEAADLARAAKGRSTDYVQITENDVQEYLNTGRHLSTRNAKRAQVEKGEVPILKNQNEIGEFVSRAIHGEKEGVIKAYGKVGNRLANEVYSKSNGTVDISGRYLELVANDLKHSWSEHREPKQSGDIPLSEQDYKNIALYVDTFDDVIDVRTFKNGVKEIQLAKKIDGYTVITEIVSNERGSIHFKNMWGVSTEKYENRYKKSRNINSEGAATRQNANTASALPAEDVPTGSNLPYAPTNVNQNAVETSKEILGEEPENVLNTLFVEQPQKPSGVIGLETDRAWQTQRLAREIRTKWQGKAGQAEVVELLDDVYSQFKAEPYESARREIAEQAAEKILSQSTRQNRELWEQYSDLHEFKVQVAKGSDLMSELQYAYGSYAAAKKELARHGVQLQQVPAGTKTYLDTDIMELADMYPEFFDAWDNDPLAMVRQMANAYDAIRPKMENQYGESYDDAVEELAGEIYSGYKTLEKPKAQPQQSAPPAEDTGDTSWVDELFPPVEDAPQMPTAREFVDKIQRQKETATADFAAEADGPLVEKTVMVNTSKEAPSELREVKEIREEGVNMALVDEVTVDEGAYFVDKRPYAMDTDRAMEQIAPSGTIAGDYMRRNLLEPFKQAKKTYAKNLTTRAKKFGNQMRELGIEPGSKQDAELQWYREGVRWVKGEGAQKPVPKAYTLADLQRDEPELWQNIVKANEIYGKWTDGYYERMNQTMEMIYPTAVADVEANIRKLEEQADGIAYQRQTQQEQLDLYAAADVDHANELMRKVQEARAAKTKAEKKFDRAKWAGQDVDRAEQNLKAAEEQLTAANRELARYPKLSEIVDLFDKLNELKVREGETRRMAQNLRAGLESGDALRNRRLPYKQNYVPHLKDSVKGLKQLQNILTANDYQIDPKLVGTSEWTKPKSRWAGFMQQRRGETPYNDGAVQNMLVQMRNYEYKLAFDPIVARSRSIISSLADATEQSRNANGAIQWLSEWTNDLAGKTSFIDRPLMNMMGRQPMAFLRWVNGRVKSNAVMGNLRSAIKQVSNLPNGIGYIKNPGDLAKGSKDYAASHLPGAAGEAARAKLEESAFLTERYGISEVYKQFETALNVVEKGERVAEAMLSLGDKAVAEYVYLAAYEQAERLGKRDPADYADEITRKTVGGRGVGEQPLVLKSQLVNLVAPFQTEILNSYNSLRERVGKKDAMGITATFVSTALLSAALEAVFGIDSDTGWNPLGDLLDALKDAEDDESTAETVQRAGQNLLGGMAANAPFAEQLISLALDNQTSKALFGDEDPTRYGIANMGVAALLKPTAELVISAMDPEKKVTDVDLLGSWGANLLPYGGAQARRTRDGLIDAGLLVEGPFGTAYPAGFAKEEPVAGHYTSSGKLMYPIDGNNFWEVLAAATLGSGATEYGRKNNGEYWSESRTADYKDAVRSGIPEKEAYNVLNDLYAVESDKDAEGKSITNSRFEKRVEYINSLNVSRDQKANLIYNYMGDRLRGYTDAAVASGMSKTDACETLVTLERIESDGVGLQGQVAYLNTRKFTPDQKAGLLYNYLSDKKKEYYDLALVAGADPWQTAQFMVFCTTVTADKDSKGKTISGSKKAKVEAELDRLNVNGAVRQIYLRAAGY